MVRRLLPIVVLAVLATSCKKKKTSNEGTGTGSAPVTGSAPANAKFVTDWNVVAMAGACSATDHGACKPDTECQPPPARSIECPAGIADGGSSRVVELEDKTCVVAPADCKAASCLGAKTPCPLPKGEALPPVSWAVSTLADGTCRASWTSPATGTKFVTIKCAIPDVQGFAIRRAGDKCTAEHAGKSVEMPCPAEPKQVTVAALRDAIAKDAAQFADQRIRVQGFFVKSLMAQTPGPNKKTNFHIGAADTKGDAKNAIKCTSVVELPELPDGDPIIVEGVAKKTATELSLVECQASVP